MGSERKPGSHNTNFETASATPSSSFDDDKTWSAARFVSSHAFASATPTEAARSIPASFSPSPTATTRKSEDAPDTKSPSSSGEVFFAGLTPASNASPLSSARRRTRVSKPVVLSCPTGRTSSIVGTACVTTAREPSSASHSGRQKETVAASSAASRSLETPLVSRSSSSLVARAAERSESTSSQGTLLGSWKREASSRSSACGSAPTVWHSSPQNAVRAVAGSAYEESRRVKSSPEDAFAFALASPCTRRVSRISPPWNAKASRTTSSGIDAFEIDPPPGARTSSPCRNTPGDASPVTPPAPSRRAVASARRAAGRAFPVATHTSTPFSAAALSASATRRVTTPSLFKSVPSRSTNKTSARRFKRRAGSTSTERGNRSVCFSAFSRIAGIAAALAGWEGSGSFETDIVANAFPSRAGSPKSRPSPRSPASADAMRPRRRGAARISPRSPSSSLASSALRSALSTRDISAASSSPSSWSMPARCATPCARSTRHSSQSPCLWSRACLPAVSTETTQSPRTVTSPKVSAGNDKTSVAVSLPRHSALSARMCASVHSATDSSTYDTSSGPSGKSFFESDSSAAKSRSRASASSRLSFAALFRRARFGSTSVDARTRASRSSATASASIGMVSEPVAGGPP
mmetsp:Transcript_12913/g.55134  ORF Transcript_12913/g.55134 Transcript_12913/m.55134 type:complete len:638 (+) Transcript_12913:119-2032(+)